MIVPWPNRSDGFALQTIGPSCPSFSSSTSGPHSFQMFLPALLGKWDGEPLWAGGAASAPSPGWEGEWPFQATLKHTPVGRIQELATHGFGYESIPSLCAAQKPSMPGPDFALGVISSAHLPLGFSMICYIALLVRCVWEALSTGGGAATQLLAWVWANQALGIAELLIRGSEPSRSSLYRVPWSEGTTNLMLQMSKTTAGAFYLDTVV